LVEKTLNQPYDESLIRKTRDEIVWAGKHSEKITKFGMERGKMDDPKYSNPDDLTRTGAISLGDSIFLFQLLSYLKSKTAIEIGTWFGTSASIMALLVDKVYTCDRNNLYVADNPKIKYYNLQSDKFLRKMAKKKIKADFCFIDARLQKGDAEILLNIIKDTFFIHDYEKGKKGFASADMLIKSGKLIPYVKNATIILTRRTNV